MSKDISPVFSCTYVVDGVDCAAYCANIHRIFSIDITLGLMSNSLSLARAWTEFIAARPEFSCGELLLRQFSAGEITRLCDCGCNSYDIAVPHGVDLPPLALPGERGGFVFQLEFNTDEWGKTVGFTLFADKDGYLSGLDVDYCGNSFPMPESPSLSEPPFHVYGALSHQAQPIIPPDLAHKAAQGR